MATRKYIKWTDEDIALLRKGIIPPNHPHNAACHLKAKQLGFSFHIADSLRKNAWTVDDIDLLKQGRIPQGKTWSACEKEAENLGLDFKILYNDSPWSDEELSILKNGSIPEHRNRDDAFQIAKKYGWSSIISSMKFRNADLDSVERGRELFIEQMKNNLSTADLAKNHSCSRQNIHRLIQLYKIDYFDKHCVQDAIK